MVKRHLREIRREYGHLSLSTAQAAADPYQQFQTWFDEVLKADSDDPTAMLLATVDKQQKPDARVVLLKDIIDGEFIFYTHYDSSKGKQLADNNAVALNFYWPSLCRQVRIRGSASKASTEVSDAYFKTRPVNSQLAAHAAVQSQVIAKRQILDDRMQMLAKDYQDKEVVRPEQWGGYRVKPDEFEFWQGRDNRLHDRLHYRFVDGHWLIERLAP